MDADRALSFIIKLMIRNIFGNKRFLRTGMLLGCVGIAAILIQSVLAAPDIFKSVIGPFKAAALILLFCFSLFLFDIYRHTPSNPLLTAWVFIAAGILWFLFIFIFEYVRADTIALRSAQKWSFIGIILLFSGFGIRLRPFLPENSDARFKLSQKSLLILTLLFIFISLLPMLRSGFYWDDAFHSAHTAVLRINGDSILQKTWHEIVRYGQLGRINPFATFQFLIFYLISSPFVYKAVILILILLDCFLFYKFVLKITGNTQIPLILLLLFPLCVQFRIYHDPILSYYGLMEMMFAELMLSLIFFLKHLDEPKKKNLFFSLLFFTVGILSYEMFYPLILFYPLLAIFHRKNLIKALRVCLPFGVIAAVLFAVSMAFRLSSAATEQAYSGTTFSLQAGKVFYAWFCQTIAAFPFSYRISDTGASLLGKWIQEQSIFDVSWSGFFSGIRWIDLAELAIAGCVVLNIQKKKPFPGLKSGYWLIGLLLLLLPGLTIALSEKYQQQLIPGLAYLPVYFEYFGAAILIFLPAAGAIRFMRHFIRRDVLLILCYASFSVIFLMNNQTNRRVIELLNQSFLYPRQTGEAALQSGILNGFDPASSLLVSNNEYFLWEQGWMREPFQADFYTLNHGSEIAPLGIPEYRDLLIKSDPGSQRFSPRNTYVIEYTGTAETGLAKYGKLIDTGFDSEHNLLQDPIVKEVLFFVYGDQTAADTVSWTSWNGAGHEKKLSENWLISADSKGRLYKLDETEGIHLDSIGLTGYR
ncbi:MAG: hypothetical protein AB9907_15685 [Flexilinea sp.]